VECDARFDETAHGIARGLGRLHCRHHGVRFFGQTAERELDEKALLRWKVIQHRLLGHSKARCDVIQGEILATLGELTARGGEDPRARFSTARETSIRRLTQRLTSGKCLITGKSFWKGPSHEPD
jgi:hypothetical protein